MKWHQLNSGSTIVCASFYFYCSSSDLFDLMFRCLRNKIVIDLDLRAIHLVGPEGELCELMESSKE